MVLVSACLMGIRCRYDGGSRRNDELMRKLDAVSVVPVCPERLGGLPTPRALADFVGGDGRAVLAGKARLLNSEGIDVTGEYLHGAERVVRLAQRFGVEEAYLKDFSPACGLTQVCIEGKRSPGVGVCAAMLADAGLTLHAVP